MRRLILISLLAPLGILSLIPAQKVGAVGASDWRAGNIITDAIFTDANSMSVSEIQSWLDSRINCDTSGKKTSELGGGTRAQYGAANGNPAPFTCLNNYYEVPKTTPGSAEPVSNYGQSTIPSGAISAAQIIYNAAQQYSISPKTLLVKLGTESPGPLTSDEWPFKRQFLYAMGAHCPDSGPNGAANCNVDYSGFSLQMSEAARLIRGYLTNMDQPWWTLRKPYATNNILWNVEPSGCGSSPVYIESKATAALYTYTPYQPNAAALNNMYGTGDRCSTYGNRNFWRVFNDWFGKTIGMPYTWELIDQSVYYDAALTRPANIRKLSANTSYYVKLSVKNSGNEVWRNTGNNPVLLATNSTANRMSPLCDESWVNCQRATYLKEAEVYPGEYGSFVFSVRMPDAQKTYTEYFRPVAEGKSWFNDIGMYLTFTVSAPAPEWQMTAQGVYHDVSHTRPANISTLAPKTNYYAVIKARNTGNTTWTNTGPNPTRLGTSNPIDRSSAFYDSSWVGGNRPATLKEASVQPGEVGTFEFTFTSPSKYGTSNEYFRGVVEGQAWMNDIGMYLPLTVAPPLPLWEVTSQAVYTDDTLSTVYNTAQSKNKDRVFLVIKARNTGNTTWTNTGPNPTRLGTSNPIDRSSAFYDSSWVGGNRPATLKEASVQPGEVGTFGVWLTLPYGANGKVYSEYFRGVVEGQAWMNDIGMYQPFTMKSPTDTWEYVGQAAYTNSALTTPADLQNASRNTTYTLVLKGRNTGGSTWTNTGPNPTRLGTSNPIDRSSAFYDSSWVGGNRPATLKEASVQPGEVGTFQFVVKTPDQPVSNNEHFRPVTEGQVWLQDKGVYWAVKVK